MRTWKFGRKATSSKGGNQGLGEGFTLQMLLKTHCWKKNMEWKICLEIQTLNLQYCISNMALTWVAGRSRHGLGHGYSSGGKRREFLPWTCRKRVRRQIDIGLQDQQYWSSRKTVPGKVTEIRFCCATYKVEIKEWKQNPWCRTQRVYPSPPTTASLKTK